MTDLDGQEREALNRKRLKTCELRVIRKRPCPVCRVLVGERCETSTGLVRSHPHKERMGDD